MGRNNRDICRKGVKYSPPIVERGSGLPLCPPGTVLGIDPGLTGAFVLTDGEAYFRYIPMPITGEEKRIDFGRAKEILNELKSVHIYLERAMPIAMGSKGAFNYGRNFEALVLAIESCSQPFTLIEPGKWTKEMHAGISADLKPKAKSLIAVKRLFPQLVASLPTKPKGGLHDGPIDALLIAGYGLRSLGPWATKSAAMTADHVNQIIEANMESSIGDFY